MPFGTHVNHQSTLPALLLLSAALAPAVPAIALIEDPEPLVMSLPAAAPEAEQRQIRLLFATAREVCIWSSERLRTLHRESESGQDAQGGGAGQPA